MEPSAAPTESPTFPPCLMERIGFLLAMTKGGAESVIVPALAELGLHVKEFGLISVLLAEGPLSQQELGRRTRLDRTSMVAFVDSLESKGLVRRERNPDDRRAYLLEVTDAGRKIHPKAKRAMVRAENELLESLSPEERDTLRDLLGRVAVRYGRPPGDVMRHP